MISTLDFFDKISILLAEDKEEDVLDLILITINDLLVEGDFYQCDYILQLVDIEKYPPVVSLMFLSATFAARHKLDFRNKFYEDVYKYYSTIFDEKKVLALLKTQK